MIDPNEYGYYIGSKMGIHETEIQAYEDTGLYYMEPKMDGIWGSAIATVNGTKFFSRNNKEKNMTMPQLPEGTILVGELGYGSEVSCKRAKLFGHDFMDVFDIIMIEGIDCTKFTMMQRRAILESLIFDMTPDHQEFYRIVDRVESGFVEFYNAQIEGAMLKRKGDDTQIHPGTETDQWIKVKRLVHVDAVIMNYTVSKAPTLKGLAEGLQLGVYKDGELFEISSVGSLTLEQRHDIIDNFESNWLNKVMEIECYRIFDSGALRHPSFNRLRDDKAPEDCTWDNMMKAKVF